MEFLTPFFCSIFLLKRDSSISNPCPEIDQPQSNIVICATLCVNFSSKLKATNVFPKHILKLKARDKLFQARKTLFCDSEELFVQRFS